MRIGLISDTHMPDTGSVLPEEVARAFEGVDLVLHAGDIRTPSCLDWLERIAPVLAVEVPPSPSMGDARVLEKRVVQVDGHSIGLVHDFLIQGMAGDVEPGIIAARFPPERSLPEAVGTFFGEPVDTVVHGHTHIPMVETHQDVLIVNPGSPTLPKHVRKLGTVGILELTPTGSEARIIDLQTFAQ